MSHRVAGHEVRPASAVYAAARMSVRIISEGLRMEVKPYNIRTTVLSPGAIATDLASSVTEPDVAKAVRDAMEIALPAETFATMVAFAMGQPDDVDINEILLRPNRAGAVGRPASSDRGRLGDLSAFNRRGSGSKSAVRLVRSAPRPPSRFQ